MAQSRRTRASMRRNEQKCAKRQKLLAWILRFQPFATDDISLVAASQDLGLLLPVFLTNSSGCSVSSLAAKSGGMFDWLVSDSPHPARNIVQVRYRPSGTAARPILWDLALLEKLIEMTPWLFPAFTGLAGWTAREESKAETRRFTHDTQSGVMCLKRLVVSRGLMRSSGLACRRRVSQGAQAGPRLIYSVRPVAWQSVELIR